LFFRNRRQKFKRLAVRIEVGLAVGVVLAVGMTLLLISLIVYLSDFIPLYQALILVALLLFFFAACGLIGVRIWEARRPLPEATEGDDLPLPDASDLTSLIRTISSGPMGVATSALVSRQLRKSPVTTSVGLVAVGLLMATQDRRRALKGPSERPKPAE
jgi:hypothetical protein